MPKLDLKEVTQYVESNIGDFHNRLLETLNDLSLSVVLFKKNPYLFKAKAFTNAGDIVKSLVDAFLSSREETIFGSWLEGLAIFINASVYAGKKSTTPGVDLEFDKDGIRYIVAIKSGPNWGNSSQIKKMVLDFNTARRILRTSSGANLRIEAVNGCCYGRDNNPDKTENYSKLCGQAFWEFISGEPDLYLKIIEPLGHKATQKNDEFSEAYGKVLNRFTREFLDHFCQADGSIDWEKLVKHNSSRSVDDKVKIPAGRPKRKVKTTSNDGTEPNSSADN
jgi:hypothetical protein